jgi:hypothetical protein
MEPLPNRLHFNTGDDDDTGSSGVSEPDDNAIPLEGSTLRKKVVRHQGKPVGAGHLLIIEEYFISDEKGCVQAYGRRCRIESNDGRPLREFEEFSR